MPSWALTMAAKITLRRSSEICSTGPIVYPFGRRVLLPVVDRRNFAHELRIGELVIPLYHELHFTFRFGDDRIIPRFHLEGVEPGRRVSVFKIDPGTGERLGLLATATAAEGGWVDLPEPILIRAGEAFVAVPMPEAAG